MKLIAIFARVRIRGLSTSGSIAALAIGAVCIAAGWTWLIILLAFYVSSTFLSRLGDDARRERAGGIAEKSGDRDVWQVAANGGVFTALALASTVRQSPDRRGCKVRNVVPVNAPRNVNEYESRRRLRIGI